jgi:hypothetical protein
MFPKIQVFYISCYNIGYCFLNMHHCTVRKLGQLQWEHCTSDYEMFGCGEVYYSCLCYQY